MQHQRDKQQQHHYHNNNHRQQQQKQKQQHSSLLLSATILYNLRPQLRLILVALCISLFLTLVMDNVVYGEPLVGSSGTNGKYFCIWIVILWCCLILWGKFILVFWDWAELVNIMQLARVMRQQHIFFFLSSKPTAIWKLRNFAANFMLYIRNHRQQKQQRHQQQQRKHPLDIVLTKGKFRFKNRF